MGLASYHHSICMLFLPVLVPGHPELGPSSFLLTPASRMGSGHSEDPSQTWKKYFANKGHQTNPPILAFLFSSPLRSHNEKCYSSQM